MTPRLSILALAAAGPWFAPAVAVAQPAVPAAPGLDCMIQPNQVVQVGTASAGVIQSIRVDRGDYVRRGQPIIQMNAEVERAALAVAREKASQTGELVATRGAQELAAREAERAARLVEENFVSRTFYEKQRAEAQVASGRGEQAHERVKLARREVELAAAQLAQRTVVAPIDGVVVERFVAPGEFVEQKPVLRIAAIDPLRVDVLVPAAQFGRVAVGARASVVPELLNRAPQAATVTSVDRVVDAASNTFRVRLELPNPGGKLPPGLRCKADLGIDAVEARQPAPPAGAVPATGAPASAAPAVSRAPIPPATRPGSEVTVAQIRRVEPVEPATPRTPAGTAPEHRPVLATAGPAQRHELARRAFPAAPLASAAQAHRQDRALATAAPAATAADAAVAEKTVRSAPLIPATPAPLRLKLAPIEWPTAVAAATPPR